MLGEVVSVMQEEVSAIDMDEGPQVQVLGPIALLPHQLLVSTSHMEVLLTAIYIMSLKESGGGRGGGRGGWQVTGGLSVGYMRLACHTDVRQTLVYMLISGCEGERGQGGYL